MPTPYCSIKPTEFTTIKAAGGLTLDGNYCPIMQCTKTIQELITAATCNQQIFEALTGCNLWNVHLNLALFNWQGS